MDHRKNKFSASHASSTKGPPLGLVIALAVAGGVIIGSAGTHFLSKSQAGPKQSASPAVGAAPQAQAITLPPQKQFTPAPQPPGEVPPGKVWSVEHGHWHDATFAPVTPPAPALPAVTPAAATTPATPAVPAEKK